MSDQSSLQEVSETQDPNDREYFILGFGEFSEDWSKKDLIEVANFRDNERIPLNSSERKEKKPGNIPYYGANGKVDEIDDYIFDDEFVLLAEDGGHFEEYQDRPIAYKISGKAWVNNHAHILESKDSVLLDYLFYSLEHRNLVPYINGSTRSKLTKTMLKKVELPVPPKSEQLKIASVLYNVDQAIQKTEEMIDQTQRVKKGLMQDLFREGYYEHDTVEGNHRWEEVPKDWDFVPLNEVAKTNPRHNKPDREIAYIEMDAVNEDVPYPDYIGRRNPQDSSGRRFEEKDTLFARITPCTENGKICFVDDIETDLGIASTELAVLSPDQDKILPKFLYHYSRTYKVRDYAISRMRGSTGRQRVPFSVFKNELMIPLPDKEEQKEIVDLLDDLDNRKMKLREEKEQLQRLKKGLMQDLLTGEVRTKDEDIEVVDEVLEVESE